MVEHRKGTLTLTLRLRPFNRLRKAYSQARRLRHKLGDDVKHPHYIQTEWGIGYRFVAPGPRGSGSTD